MTTQSYQSAAPTRDEVDVLAGPTVLDFGTNWCGHCRRAGPIIEQALTQQSDVRHIRIEDGPGRRLGRSYRVKLWPTLIFLKDGAEVARLVRPTDVEDIRQALAETTG